MANKHLVKRSAVTGRAPVTAELDFGELALNFADGKLYYKDVNGNLQYFAAGEPGSGGVGGEGSSVTVDTTPPQNPLNGDLWWNSEDATLYIYYTDSDSSQWVVANQGNVISTGADVDLTSVSSSIVPDSNEVYDLGSPDMRWKDLYLSGNTINLGGATIKTDASSGAIALLPQPTVENPNPSGVVISPTGGVTVVETTGGELAVGAIEEAATSPTAAPVPIDITTTAPQDGQSLIWQSANSKFVPGNVSGGGSGGSSLSVYAEIEDLPMSSVLAGTMAFVSGNNRLYLWNGVGWFNIALINTTPTITGGLNSAYVFATDGTPVVLTLIANDPEGVPLTWSYQVTSGVVGNTATISQSNNVFTITPSSSDDDAGLFQLTFIASDGINVATASSVFTLAFGTADTYYNQSVVVLTTATDTGNNNSFVDSSGNSVSVIRNGNTTQGTLSPYSPNGWSGLFDGTGDYLSTPYSSELFDWWTEDFTIEAWVYPTSFTGWSYLDGLNIKPTLIGNNAFNSSTNYWSFGLTTTGSVHFAYFNGSAQGAGTSAAANLNAWNHIALVKSGSSVTLYLNGVGTSIGNVSGTPQSSTGTPLTIGAGNNAYINGYVSNLRVVKGTAVYTSNFTVPTTSLTVIAGTSLLALQSNRLIDTSTNNLIITRSGDVSVQAYSPFRAKDIYSASVVGGSAYFDGTGDYLSAIVGSAPGTGDFTFESWAYFTNLSAARLIFTTRSGNTTDGLQVQLTTGGQWKVGYAGIDFISTATGTGTVNQWYHVAVTRASGTVTLWVNGISMGSSARGQDFSNTAVRLGLSAENLLPMFGYISNARYTIGTALYTDTFTPPTAPLTPTSETALLINSGNADIYDETGKVVLETVGSATVNTSVKKYGNGSILLNGTTDYVTIPNNPVLNFASGDFTVEAWVYPTAATGEHGIVSLYGYSSNRRSWYIALDGTKLEIRFSSAGSSATATLLESSSGAVALNEWQHVAFVRSGTSMTGYVNGVSVVSGTFSGSLYNNLIDPVIIGAVGPTITGFFQGYISDVRITKGVARYISSFTPPTEQLGFTNPL
jgi:hypothetical protein